MMERESGGGREIETLRLVAGDSLIGGRSSSSMPPVLGCTSSSTHTERDRQRVMERESGGGRERERDSETRGWGLTDWRKILVFHSACVGLHLQLDACDEAVLLKQNQCALDEADVI